MKTIEDASLSQCNSARWTIKNDQTAIKITFGEMPEDQQTEEYSFDTHAELLAFLLGVDDTVGFMEYRIVTPRKAKAKKNGTVIEVETAPIETFDQYKERLAVERPDLALALTVVDGPLN